MKKLTYVAMLLLAACSSTNGSNAQAATPAKEPCCAECPPDAAHGEKKASCCEAGAAEKKSDCCEAGAAEKKTTKN